MNVSENVVDNIKKWCEQFQGVEFVKGRCIRLHNPRTPDKPLSLLLTFNFEESVRGDWSVHYELTDEEWDSIQEEIVDAEFWLLGLESKITAILDKGEHKVETA